MARIDNLHNFLEDVATAIKTKKGDTTPIQVSNFDNEILNISSETSRESKGIIFEEIDERGFVTKARTSCLENISSGFFRNVNSSIGCFVSLQQLTFDVSVKAVESAAFRENSNLTTVIFEGKPDSISATAFTTVGLNVTDIYVPWSEGEVINAPWGCNNAIIHYDTIKKENLRHLQIGDNLSNATVYFKFPDNFYNNYNYSSYVGIDVVDFNGMSSEESHIYFSSQGTDTTISFDMLDYPESTFVIYDEQGQVNVSKKTLPNWLGKIISFDSSKLATDVLQYIYVDKTTLGSV